MIPPLSAKAYKELEDSIRKDGFDVGFPLVVWNGILVDGHNRLALCKKYNLKPTTVNKEFKNREEAILWIINRSMQRRQLTPKQIKVLRALRYEREKHPHGGDRKSSMQKEHLKKTTEVIAEDEGVNPSTIQRDATWLRAAQEIAKNAETGLYELIDKRITVKDMLDIANQSPDIQRKVVAKINSKEAKNSKSAIKAVEEEESIKIFTVEDQEELPQPPQPRNTRADLYKCVSDFFVDNPENKTAEVIARILHVEEGVELSFAIRSHLVNDFEVLRREMISEDSDEVFQEMIKAYTEHSECELAEHVSKVVDKIIDIGTSKKDAIKTLGTEIRKLRGYIAGAINEWEDDKLEEVPKKPKPKRKSTTCSFVVAPAVHLRMKNLKTKLKLKSQGAATAWIINKTAGKIDLDEPFEKTHILKGEKEGNLGASKASKKELLDMQIAYKAKYGKKISWAELIERMLNYLDSHPSLIST